MGARNEPGEPSEDVVRGLLAAAPDALLAVDEEGVIVFVSDQAERLFGWPRADLVGQRVETLIPARFLAGHPGLRRGYVDHPTPRPMGAGLDLWALRRDGSEFPAEISLSGFTTTTGRLIGVAIRDVTQARRNEQRFRAVLASAPDAIVGVDASGRIELLNGQTERLFGWAAADLLGQQIEVLVPEELHARHVQHRASFIAEPSARPMGAGLQLSARRKDGSTFPAEISLSSVEEPGGATLTLAAVRDVTDRVEMERERRRQALEAQRQQSHRLESLGQLAGGVAHDFNNLLGVILNYGTLLSRQLTDAQAAGDIAEIVAAAERASALTRQLLAFARRDVANPEPWNVNTVVGAFSSLLERTLGENIALRLELTTDDEPVVLIDPHQLEQVLLNLALNSRDAMRQGGTLTIATSTASSAEGPSSGGTISLRVTDTGDGMEPDVLEHVFEPFFTTKPRGEGTGLGLSTVFGIVRQNNGEISIESAPGRGTSVILTLPRAGAPAASRDRHEHAVPGGSECVLLVEDEPALRVVTERILREHGYEVLTAGDGVEALRVFDAQHERIDLVLTDVAMPLMRGDELGRRLRERRPGARLLFMSGYASSGPPPAGRLLEKPVAEHQLLRAVREVLDA